MGFLSILTLIFIILKLTAVITWSWWLVLLPMIIKMALLILVFIILAALSCCVGDNKSNFKMWYWRSK